MATNIKFYKQSTTPVADNGSVLFDTKDRALKLKTGGDWVNFGVTKEAFLEWGGKNFAGSFGPIDAAMVPELGANRFAFFPKEGINMEASTDGGKTWSSYTLNSNWHYVFAPRIGASFYIGNRNTTNINKTNDQLRITLTTDKGPCYSELNKFVIYIATAGSNKCWCTISGRTKANVETDTDTWVTFAEKIPITGWSGWNVINTPTIVTYGNQSYQYQNLRFTFGSDDSPETNNYQGLSIYTIMGFGGVGWNTPSNMAKYGRLYTWNSAQDATFPAAINATTGFYLKNSSNDYVLLGAGGTKKISDLTVSTASELTWAEYK